MANSVELNRFLRKIKGTTGAQRTAMLSKKHPLYAEKKDHWDFVEDTFNGGREWFQKHIFKYIKEGQKEYEDRVKRAYRFAHTRETVNLTNKYIFKGQITRNEADASQAVKDFWKSTTLQHRGIADFMPLASQRASVFGRVWVVVDSNASSNNSAILSAKENGERLYAYTLRPQDVMDLAYADDGSLSWMLVSERKRDDADITSSGAIIERVRYWTQQFWALFEIVSDNGTNSYRLVDARDHGLGRVPIEPADHAPSECPYTAPALIEEIAYLDRAVANYLSNLDAIIQDQAFSQLIMPAQALLPGDDEQEKILELGTKRIFTYDGQATVPPQYISPDPKQAAMILSVINKIVGEIYHSIGMAGERTKEDNAMGIDNSSGVAKAYDFERLNAMLAAKARSLQTLENRLCELVDTWHGKNVTPGTYALVTYPESFDVRALADELQLAEQLQILAAPDGVRRQQMDAIIDKIFPQLGKQLIAKLKEELKSWPPEPPVLDQAADGADPFKESKQGQNPGPDDKSKD